MPSMAVAGAKAPAGVEFVDPGRSYASTAWLAALLVAGFLLDLGLGGGRAHLVGWLVAFVLVVGIDALIVRAARTFRRVELTATELRYGEQRLPRAAILGYQSQGRSGVSLHLTDGRTLLVPTRHAEVFAAALGAGMAVADIRPADGADAAAIADIEQRSRALYRVAGMDLPDAYSPTEGGGGDDRVVLVSGRPPEAFVRLTEVDGAVNIAAMAVVPKRMNGGLGTALLDAACGWARGHGYRAITVTTYADVDWSAEFFAARGFTEATDLGPEMLELRDWERAVGLDEVGRRVVLRRELRCGGGLSAAPCGSRRRGGSPRR